MGVSKSHDITDETAIRLVLRRTSIEPKTNCWMWLGSTMTNGYGNVQWAGKVRPVHRVVYEKYFGQVPAGLDLDHLCRQRLCCNPFHLEPVTRAENCRRSPYTFKAQCRNGHDMTPENVYEKRLVSGKTARYCRICSRAAQRRCQEGRI